MPDVCSCPLCNKEFSFPGLKKHLFSTSHIQDMINAIHKKKITYNAWLYKFAASPNTTPFPRICFTDKEADACQFCTVCKSIRYIKNNRPLTCNHKSEIAEFIRECLKKEVINSVVEETPAEDDQKMLKDLTALKKQVNRLQSQVESLKSLNEEASDDADALYTLLTHFHETDSDIFYQMMTHIKTSNPATHARQLKNFEEEA
jgi:hypothetical protein